MAKLNKICTFYLNKATYRNQNRNQTRLQLEQNRPVFEQIVKVFDELQIEVRESQSKKQTN